MLDVAELGLAVAAAVGDACLDEEDEVDNGHDPEKHMLADEGQDNPHADMAGIQCELQVWGHHLPDYGTKTSTPGQGSSFLCGFTKAVAVCEPEGSGACGPSPTGQPKDDREYVADEERNAEEEVRGPNLNRRGAAVDDEAQDALRRVSRLFRPSPTKTWFHIQQR